LEAAGHPIAGDRKYGAATNPLGRVALHAGTITFVHPVSGETLSFGTPLPYKFGALFRRG
jgi:23S rRNA pseudouridine1911/1915/1917 synthase